MNVLPIPFWPLYPFQNETRISNRGGNIFLYVTRAIWKGIRSRFHFGMGIPFKPLPRTLSQRGFKTTIPQIDFTKYGLNGIRHPKLQDLNVIPFILPSAGMSAETHDHILNIQKSLPFAKRNNLEFGQESSSRRTYHSEGGLFLGRESITRHDIPQTRRYLVKISPLKMGFLAAREAASV